MIFFTYWIPRYIFSSCCLLLAVASCSNQTDSKGGKLTGTPSQDQSTPSGKSYPEILPSDSNSRFNYQIIDAPEGTFGYEIIAGGKVMIHQPNIPGMPGLKGFTEKESAARVAELVIRKLMNNEMPPTVSIEELKDLGVEK